MNIEIEVGWRFDEDEGGGRVLTVGETVYGDGWGLWS